MKCISLGLATALMATDMTAGMVFTAEPAMMAKTP